MLEIHNRVRSVHNSNPLILSGELCQIAQKLAENILLNKIGKLKDVKFPDQKYGKSVTYVVGNALPNPKSVCNVWYDGKRYYNFDDKQFNNQNGIFHFLQVVLRR